MKQEKVRLKGAHSYSCLLFRLQNYVFKNYLIAQKNQTTMLGSKR